MTAMHDLSMTDEGAMKTGEVAHAAGVNIQTLRYYERRGLLAEPPRRQSGYRMYGPEAVRLVRFVKRAQELGFSLDDVEALLHLAQGGPESCDSAQSLARQKIDELEGRIRHLRAMRKALLDLVATCDLPRSRRDCPLMTALDPAAQPGKPRSRQEPAAG
jgi:MerR family transcriptional regulator, mercuric resistance operon regulatory protein